MAKTSVRTRESKKPRAVLSSASGDGNRCLYTLEVILVGGPVTEEFADENPKMSRTIQIRGDQTLEALHDAIFDAYDRFDDHMYEFQFGKKPMQGPRYGLSMAREFGDDMPSAGTVEETTIDSLNLSVKQRFLYWFDFGDDWWHRIDVNAIDSEIPKGKYPKVIKRVGASPPQYPDIEEDE